MSMAKSAKFGSKIMKVKYGEADMKPTDRDYMVKVFGKEWADNVDQWAANIEIAATREQVSKKKPALLDRILKMFRKEVK